MDFSKLDVATTASAGEALELKHPVTGEILQGVKIFLRGMDSPEFQNTKRVALNRRLEQSARRGSQAPITVERLDQDNIDIFVAVTIGWEGVELDGKLIEFSPEKARLLYNDRRFPWVVEQIDEFVGDRKNFYKPS